MEANARSHHDAAQAAIAALPEEACVTYISKKLDRILKGKQHSSYHDSLTVLHEANGRPMQLFDRGRLLAHGGGPDNLLKAHHWAIRSSPALCTQFVAKLNAALLSIEAGYHLANPFPLLRATFDPGSWADTPGIGVHVVKGVPAADPRG